MTERVYTNEQLQERLAYWQARLGLRDWDITATIVRATKMSDTDRVGECHVFPPKRRATVYLVDETDWAEATSRHFPVVHDMEYTLVHELVHVVLDPLDPESREEAKAKEVALEQAVHALAQALIRSDG